jgi:NADH-quinone oxidoreductase subunit D
MSLGPFAIEEMGEETMILFIGPQHPGSGHLRIIVELDGDVVVGIWPDIGWVHRTVTSRSSPWSKGQCS